MSVDVLTEVFRASGSRGVARNVLTVLADAAHPDGVTWLPIEPSKNGGDATKCITHRANASKRAVIDAIASLRDAGEIEVRQAQRGQSRFNVYRIVLGTVGWMPIDYSDLPFAVEQPFSDHVQNLHVVSNEETGVAGCSSRDDEVQISSPRGADFVSVDEAIPPAGAGDSSSPRLPEPSREPSLQPSAADQEIEVPAAEAPVSDREIVEAVRSLPSADAGSPAVVIPIAHGLPRSVFAAVVETVRARRGRVGLLVDLLRIARAERTAALSAQLARELGATAPAYVPAPWLVDSLKREDPARYVRIMAATPTYPADLVGEALGGHPDVDRLVELFVAVRAGAESGDRLGTPVQERLRWVEAHADDPDADAVIDAWDDVDTVERQSLHERVEQLRIESDTKREAA